MNKEELMKFQKDYCRLCCTQRCPGDEEVIMTCSYFFKEKLEQTQDNEGEQYE